MKKSIKHKSFAVTICKEIQNVLNGKFPAKEKYNLPYWQKSEFHDITR